MPHNAPQNAPRRVLSVEQQLRVALQQYRRMEAPVADLAEFTALIEKAIELAQRAEVTPDWIKPWRQPDNRVGPSRFHDQEQDSK